MSGTSQMTTRPPKWHSEAVLDIYNLFLAALLLVSPWIFAYAREIARTDIWVSGAAIALIAVAAIFSYANWREWLNVLLGVWLIASPWLLGFAHTKAMHFSIGIVALMALTELLIVNYPSTENPPPPA